jgi:hypothetical protein
MISPEVAVKLPPCTPFIATAAVPTLQKEDDEYDIEDVGH